MIVPLGCSLGFWGVIYGCCLFIPFLCGVRICVICVFFLLLRCAGVQSLRGGAASPIVGVFLLKLLKLKKAKKNTVQKKQVASCGLSPTGGAAGATKHRKWLHQLERQSQARRQEDGPGLGVAGRGWGGGHCRPFRGVDRLHPCLRKSAS